MDSSTSIAIRLRYSIVVGFISDSPRDITGNSTGNPPACSTPRLTDSASPRRWMLQLTSSDHELQIPITGRPRNVSSVTPVDLSQDRCRKPSRSLRSNHSSLRRPPFRRPMFPPLRIVAMSLLTGGGRSERCCHLLGLPRSGLSYDLWVEVAAGIHRIE